ncbi:hypothetical protein QE152_g8990 [Popillia japonica]|uniref:Retrotransposon gag domain-containing protein n=1 Tax=Popillia japonica TaxID=7064 RepID=A0AAW1LYP4_POPJA
MALQAVFTVETFEKKKWTRWIERLEGAFTISKITEEESKKHLLSHYMGQEAYDILSDKLAPQKPQDKSYQEIEGTLQTFFEHQPLEIVENYKFHLRKQAETETAEEFMVVLRNLAIHCNFGSYLDTALRNQFVFGLGNKAILNRLFEKENLKAEDALKIAKSMKMPMKGAQKFKENLLHTHI